MNFLKSATLTVGLLVSTALTIFAQTPAQRAEQPTSQAQTGIIKFGGVIGRVGDKPNGEMTKTVSKERIYKECKFYSADSLKGFDFEGKAAEYKRLELYMEFRNALHQEQDAFIKKKYKISELPHEHVLRHTEPNQVLASSCGNLDFEDGNFGSWVVSSGYNTNSNGNLTVPGAGAGTGITGTNQAYNSCYDANIITSAFGNDLVGGFPGLCPTGGTYSARIGSYNMNTAAAYGFNCDGYKWSYTYSNGEIVEQTFPVTASNALVSFNYAIILNDAGSSHLNGEQPYFHVYVKNASTGAVLSTCTQYSVQATGGAAPAGFTSSGYTNGSDGTPLYKRGWTSNSINLSAYIGQTVNIEFVTAGCVYGAHMAWAYVDVTCGPADVLTSNAAPCIGSTVSLTAPAVAGGTYSWSGPAGGISGSSTGQTITATASGTYTVTVTPSQGASCSYTLTKVVTFQPIPNTAVNSTSICSGQSATLNATGATSYLWSTGSGASSISVSPASTTVYTVTGTTGGCQTSATATVNVSPNPTASVSGTASAVCSGASSNLTATGSSGASNVTFSSTSSYSVPDNNPTGISSPITVSGLSGTVGSSLLNVNLSIAHLNDADLDIYLVCPGGTQITLSSGNGFTGDNYTNTTFQTGGTAITSGAAPFTGTYAPQSPFSGLSACSMNGTWNLVVVDHTTGVTGTLLNWSITFSSTAVTYSWSPGTGLSSTTTAATTATPSSTTIYTTTVTNFAGCTNTATYTVTVNPVPSMTSASSATVCSGTALNIPLTASASSNYTWVTTDNGNTTGESTATQNTSTINNTININAGVSTAQTLTYTVTPTGTAGSCVGSAQQVTVTVNPRPALSAMSNITTACVGANVSVPNYTVTPASTINWTVSPAGSGLAASGSGNIGSFTAGTAGTYTVSATATTSSGSCASSSPTNFTLTVNALPNVTSTSSTVCSGQSATITAGGATTYTWSTGATSAGLTINPATTTTSYTVTGTNTATTCTNTAVGTITVNPLPNVAATSTTVCSGQSATLTASGATTYTWSTGANGAGLTINPATATATYTVTGTDGNSCTKQATGTVTVNPLPTVTAAASTQTVCAGSTVNAISFSTNPATGITVNWANTNAAIGLGTSGSGTSIPAFTAANVASQTTGVITATVTNTSTGCSSNTTTTGTITINPRPVVASTSATVCSGQSATITASGANTYSWNTGAGTAGLTINPATTTTTYTVTGTNTATTCTNTAVGTITVNALPNVAATSTTVCNGQSATLTASGATTYTWSTSATGSNLTINPASATASYTVTGTDGNNCVNTAVGTINVNPLPTVSAASSSQTVCAGNTVNAITFNTNPVSGTTVTWTNTNTSIGLPASGSGSTINGYTAPNVGVQTQGTITAIVTNTSTGCSSNATATGTIIINPNPTVSTPATVANPSTCAGSNGSLTGLVVSGANPITYSWNGGAYSGANIGGLPAGNYNLLATDNNGCTVTAAYSLTDPNPPAAPSFGATTPPVICAGGSVTLSVTNSVGTQTYNWVGPGGPIGTGSSITITPASSGSYNVYTTEAGCTGNVNAGAAVNVTVNANPTAVITSNSTAFCVESSTTLDGQTSLGGGTGSVTNYQWLLNGSPLPGAINSTYVATQAGNYQLQVTNSFGCVNTSGNTGVTINPEPAFSATAPNSTNSNCIVPTGAIGDVTPATVSSGAPNYTYSWYGTSGLITSTMIASTTAPALLNQSAGTYTLIVVDNNGCNDTLTASIVNANAPNAPAISGTNPANCSGTPFNPITMNGTGGITWYSDPSLTNVVSFSNPFTPTNTTTQTYYVTDSINGCQSLATQVVVTVIQTPSAPSVTNVAACQGNQVPDVVAVNNNGSGVVNWYSDAALTNQIGTGSPYASGVTSGVTVIYAAIQDSVCVGQGVPVIISINTPPTINTTSMAIDSASCGGASNGGVHGVVVGGTPNFTYAWSNASGTFSTSTIDPNLVNAPVGSYTLTVTDGNGCVSNQGPVNVVSNSTPGSPVFVTSSDTVYCAGETVTTLTANAGSGTVMWYSDAALTNQIGIGNSITPTGITTSTTIYVVANNSNCISSTVPVSITFNPLPSVSANSPVVCNGGSVTLNGSGAASYVWDNGVTDGVSFVPGANGLYTVTGTDVNGCVNTYVATVTVNSLPVVGATQGSSTAVCAGNSVTLSGTGATSYTWTNGISDGVSFVPSANGSYVVTGTDANGCTNTFTVSLTVNSLPTVDAGATADTIPCGSVNYVINTATTTATNPVYQWTGPNVVANGNTATPVIGSAGSYTLVVTDGNTGCVAQDVINIVSNTVIANFTQDVTSGFNPLTVNFTNTSSGAITYAWNFGDGNVSTSTDPANTFNAMGTYQVILTAMSNGCTDTASVIIIVNENSSIIVPNIFSPNGDGINDVLTIFSTGIEEMNIDVFNRWGQKVYVISAPGQSWDGKLSNGSDAAEGTYFYILRAVGFDKKEYEAQGPVMLVK